MEIDAALSGLKKDAQGALSHSPEKHVGHVHLHLCIFYIS